ncbi:uncharacterized protein DUF2442 [Plasticicumulans lactativorans]|uniref:Uncharacterized protein DUF2442 n=1 Tax=Plasticicumulans lactativorans TaxID=1133106 RepID=A0A4R2L9P2_9GAMM|nr:DUF2442 domain-containing protein [Plasticicumulans lactativorans]TCO80866.1 uncharacterized protein DUF2442 [Plasticicumulans lactativorans]
MNIAEVIPKDNYVLFVIAEDGKTGLFDLKPYLESDAFAPLKDKNEFELIHNGKYFIEWDCGADLSADTIQARWEIASTENAQQVAPVDAQKRRG